MKRLERNVQLIFNIFGLSMPPIANSCCFPDDSIFCVNLHLYISQVIIITSTSFLGAYGTMQALDYFIEKGQVTFYVLEILFYGKTDKLPKCWYTWFVLAWIPALFIIGMVIQFKITGKQYDHRSGTIYVNET